jgi:hypothetical protein
MFENLSKCAQTNLQVRIKGSEWRKNTYIHVKNKIRDLRAD